MSSGSPSYRTPRIPWLKDSVPGATYKKGDVISGKEVRYEVFGILGKGGFGIVYLVFAGESGAALALKTFQDEYLDDALAKDRFRKEASVWVDLERHPYLVRAYLVDEIAGRLFVAAELIVPDEQGLNSLEGFLRQRPPDLVQSLRWIIQFCHGMEYAYSKGIRCHRDIKPANIMIDQDKTVRITDFGLASAVVPARPSSGITLNVQERTVGLSCQTMEGTGFGTPTHMPTEQFTDAGSCDERSDIYAFGVVMFQMASGGRLPFLAPLPLDRSDAESARFWREMHRLHASAPVPKLDSLLFPIIRRCLEKKPRKRYESFKELRAVVEALLKRKTGEVVVPPELKTLEVWEMGAKGYSLRLLGRNEEAINCFDRALQLDPLYAPAWNNKGNYLHDLGRDDDAVRCYERALELDPHNAGAWNNKGASLRSLSRNDEAIRCYDKALELDPLYAGAWENKARCLSELCRHEEAIHCCEKALDLDQQNAGTWSNKGLSLSCLDRHEEAILCYDKALELDQLNADTLSNKGLSLICLDRHEEAIRCFENALQLVPKAGTWCGKGLSLRSLGRDEEAIRCFDKALELDPRDAKAWNEKGACLGKLGRCEEAIGCYDRALELDPRNARTWCEKGTGLARLGRHDEAISCYDKTLQFDPLNGKAWYSKELSLGILGRDEEALRCCDRALELCSNKAEIWTQKGTCLGSLGRYEEAIRCFDKTLEFDPRDAWAWFYKGQAQDELGRRHDASRSYKQFVALAPDQCSEQLSYARRRLGELEGPPDLKTLEADARTKAQARTEIARLCTAIIAHNYRYHVLAQPTISDYDYDQLQKRLGELGARFPELVEWGWTNEGASLHKLGRYDEAIRCYDRALVLDPRYAAAWYCKGLAQEKLGWRWDALRSYQQFIAFGPDRYAEEVEHTKKRVRELEGE
jgi:tetratricopeptide (TPR) repeat protein